MDQQKNYNMDSEHNFEVEHKNLAHNCSLDTIVKKGLNPADFSIDSNKKIENPAKTYPFELDDFQKAAVHSVENNISVLVAAHTSAGKTAIAEYVIA